MSHTPTPKNRVKGDTFHPLKDKVFVSDLDAGMHLTSAGIIIPDDAMKERGIRDRWARVYAVGPEITDIQSGEWVLVKHGRWTTGIDLELTSGNVRVWAVDYPENVLIATDEDPREALPTTFDNIVRFGGRSGTSITPP